MFHGKSAYLQPLTEHATGSEAAFTTKNKDDNLSHNAPLSLNLKTDFLGEHEEHGSNQISQLHMFIPSFK